MKKKVFTTGLFAGLLLISFLIACVDNRQLQIDPSLHSHSQMVQAKTARIKPGKGLCQVSFGSFDFISLERLDSGNFSRHGRESLLGQLIFRTDNSIEKLNTFCLQIATASDTGKIVFTLLLDNDVSKPSILFHRKDAVDEQIVDNKRLTGKVITSRDTSVWTFDIGPYVIGQGRGGNLDVNGLISGYLANRLDTFYAESVTSLVFANAFNRTPPFQCKGVTFKTKHGEYVSALQFFGHHNIWIRQDIADDYKLVMAAVFSAIVGTKKL